MRLLACFVLTTVVASAFAQEYVTEAFSKSSVIHLYPTPYKQLSRSAIEDYRAQIEAVNALPNVDVQMLNETIRADDNTTETESAVSAVDPSSAIVNAVNETVNTVFESLSKNATVSEDEAVVVDEAVEDPAQTMEVTEEEDVVDADETLLEEDEPMLQVLPAETQAPETTIDGVEATVMSVAEPEPEPAPEDMPKDEKFDVEDPESVVTVGEEVKIEEPHQPTKKDLKAIEKYNAAVDNVVKILSSRLTMKDALPLNVSDGTLEELDVEVTTVPPTTTSTTTTTTTTTEAPTPQAGPKCSTNWAEKCATEKCKNKEKCMNKCKAKGCITKKIKKTKKNKKNNNRKDEEKSNNKKKQNNNKNKNKKNKRKNNNKRIDTSKIFSNRQSKNLDLEEEQARRAGSETIVEKGKNKGKKARKNKKKSNDKSRLEDLKPEAKLDYVPLSAEEGTLFATNEELLNSRAIFTGFSSIRRIGDVKVDLSGRNAKFIATIAMGPLDIHLTNPASQLQRTEVTTELTATMHFTAKTVRNRDKLKINEVVVQVPEYESVSVMRSDLELEPEVVSVAQSEVSSGIDTERIARIIHRELAASFNEDNILQNLENHPSLKIKHLY